MSQYRVPVLENFEWQQKVISATLTLPPVTPVKGDRYIVASPALGDWLTKENQIAWYDGAAWMFDAPAAGWIAYNTATSDHLKYTGSAWTDFTADMNKSVYDTDNDGIVDKAESVDDGAGNASTAADVKDAVTKKHTQGTDQFLDQGGANQVSAADAKDAVTKKHTQGTDQFLDQGGANQVSAAQVKGAVTNSHVQGTDQGLDAGGANAITAAQAKQAYDRRGSYDADLKVILFNL